ncbi:MAG: hypothetical protein ABII74_00420 [Elusimicrobiota bacterium]
MKELRQVFTVVLAVSLLLAAVDFSVAGSMDDRSFWKLREQAIKRRQAAQKGVAPGKAGEKKSAVPGSVIPADSAGTAGKSVIPDNFIPSKDADTGADLTTSLPDFTDEEYTDAEDIGLGGLPALAPEDIRVAGEYGSVSDLYNPGKADQKLIIHIRDAHCHYEAQKNIAKLLEGLIKDYGVNLVLLEGSSEENSLADLRTLNTRENREKVADRYLRQGLISGEEYLDVVSDLNFSPRGVENFAVYKKHVRAYGGLAKIKVESQTVLSKIETSLVNLKSRIFNKDLKEMDQNRSAYETEKLSLPQYCFFLGNKAASRGVAFNKEFRNFHYFYQVNKIEGYMDFAKAEKERDKILSSLRQKLSKTALMEFNDQIEKYKRDELTTGEFYSYVRNTAEDTGVDLRQSPQFNFYVLYVKYSEEMDTIALFNEIKQLERKTKQTMYETEEQKRLDKAAGQIALLKGMVEFSLSPDDYLDWEKNRSEIKTYNWAVFLDAELTKYGFSPLDFKTGSYIKKYLPKYEEFYQLALERDKTLFENSLAEMDKNGQKVAVLIAGGFHTPRITKMMQDKEIAYTVILPTITQEGNPDLYTSAMKLTMSALE